MTAITQKTSQEVLVEAVSDLHLAQHMMVSHLKKTCISEKMIANSRFVNNVLIIILVLYFVYCSIVIIYLSLIHI